MPGFLNRVLLLLCLMAVFATIDFVRKGARASKHLEYGFVLFSGILGALARLSNDLITSSISPEYFIYGKGLDAGDGFRWRAGLFGMKEGLSARIIGGAICLFATTRKSGFSKSQLGRLLGMLWMPLAGAAAFGFGCSFIGRAFDPFHIARELTSLLSSEQISTFLQVWWIHTGLYIGIVVGLGVMIALARRQMAVAEKS